MTTCPQCGAENLPGMAYCEHCGTPLPTPEAVAAPIPPVDTGAADAIAGAQAVLDELHDDPAEAPAPAPSPVQPPDAAPAAVPAGPADVTAAPAADPAIVAPVSDAAAPAADAAPTAPSSGDAAFPVSAPPLDSQKPLALTLAFGDETRFIVQHDVTNVGRADVAQNWHPELDVIPLGGGDPNFGVSRHQAVIKRDGTTFSILDVGSTNGTYVNGHMLEYNKPIDLHDGDTLAFGAFNATVHIG